MSQVAGVHLSGLPVKPHSLQVIRLAMGWRPTATVLFPRALISYRHGQSGTLQLSWAAGQQWSRLRCKAPRSRDWGLQAACGHWDLGRHTNQLRGKVSLPHRTGPGCTVVCVGSGSLKHWIGWIGGISMSLSPNPVVRTETKSAKLAPSPPAPKTGIQAHSGVKIITVVCRLRAVFWQSMTPKLREHSD